MKRKKNSGLHLNSPEEKFNYQSLILESIGEAVIGTDSSFNITYWNKAAEELYGWKLEEVLGKNAIAVTRSETKQEEQEHLNARLLNGGRFKLEVVHRRKTGERLLLEAILVGHLDDEGCYSGYVGIFRDVTGEKKQQEELNYQKKLLETTLEALPVGIHIFDKDGVVKSANNEARKIWGGIGSEAQEKYNAFKAWDYNTGRELQNQERSAYRALTSGEETYQQTIRVSTFDGKEKIILNSTVPVLDENRNIMAAVSVSQNISELMRIENELRISEERFRIAQELSPDAFVILAPVYNETGEVIDFSFLYQNPAAIKIRQLLLENVTGEHLLEVLEEIGTRRLFGICRQVYETRQPIEFEEQYARKSATGESWFRVVAVPTSSGIAIYAHEITNRKKTEEALQTERSLLDSIINSIPVMITIFDPGTRRFRLNSEIKRVFGYSEEDARDASFLIQAYPETGKREEVIAYMKQFDIGWKEFQPVSKWGETIESSWSNIKLESGWEIGIGLDLRLIKKAERELRESRTRLVEAQRLTQAGSYFTDYRSVPPRVEFSEELYRIFGIDREKEVLSEKLILDRIHPNDLPLVTGRNKLTSEGKCSDELEYRIVLPDGSIKYLYTRREVLFDEKGKPLEVFGTTLDITRRKTAELKLKNTLQELERSNRELEHFAHIVSHDLQEPLRMVSNFTQLLTKKLADKITSKEEQFIAYIVNGTKLMQNLISDLLKFSRLSAQETSLEETDLNHIVELVLDNLSFRIIEKGARITCDPLPVVNADKIKMIQLFQNLIGNALKFTRDIVPEIHIGCLKEGGNWKLSVKDNGIGIVTGQSERIFEIFQRLHTRDEFEGSGIGLSICRKITEHHGGTIWVESEAGKGSIFYFTIPQ